MTTPFTFQPDSSGITPEDSALVDTSVAVTANTPLPGHPDDSPHSVHPVDQLPPWGKLFGYGFQHVLAMYAGTVAVPIIVGGAMIAAGEMQPEHLPHLIVADLFVAGIRANRATNTLGPAFHRRTSRES